MTPYVRLFMTHYITTVESLPTLCLAGAPAVVHKHCQETFEFIMIHRLDQVRIKSRLFADVLVLLWP